MRHGFEKLKICTQYKYNGQLTGRMPFDIVNANLEPVYAELPGWNEDLTGIKDISKLPRQLHNYIDFIERELKVPVTIVSVGPDRTQTMMRKQATLNVIA